MNAMMPIQAKRPLIVCPATDDGLACSVILNRQLVAPINTLYLPENDVGKIAAYPAVAEHRNDIGLYIAGFAWQKEVAGWQRKRLPAKTVWYSHHFWSEEAYDQTLEAGIDLIVNPEFDSTSRLLLDALTVTDRISTSCAKNLSMGRVPGDPVWRDWFHVFLSVRGDLFGIRHALDPLFARGKTVPKPPENLIASGREIYDGLDEHIRSGSPYRFPVGKNHFACVLGLARSFAPFYRIVSRLAFETKGCSIALLLLDATEQIIVVRDERAEAALPTHFLTLALDRCFGKPTVGLYDRNIFVLSPGGALVDAVDRIARGLAELDASPQ